MKFEKIVFVMLLNISFSLFAQESPNSSRITVDIIKSKLVNNGSIFGIRPLRVTSEDLRKVIIKTKISSTNEKTTLSAFSLLDTKNKIRYRLADYKGYIGFIGNPELIPFRKDKIYNEKGKEMDSEWLPPHDNTEKDYFYEYNQEGYTNFEMNTNFGTTNNPKLSIIYFGRTRYEKFTAELYFAILIKNIDCEYELYYKNEKISKIIFK